MFKEMYGTVHVPLTARGLKDTNFYARLKFVI